MNLTKFANDTLDKFAPAYVDDLCNALAGMEFTERNAFVKAMVARAPDPMTPPKTLTAIEKWWEQKVRTGIMLSARPEEGWLRELRVADLTDDYIAFTKRTGISPRGAATAMGVFLNKVMPNLKTSSLTAYVDVQAGDADGESYRPGTVNQVKHRVRHYEFPAHDVAKRFWMEYVDQRS